MKRKEVYKAFDTERAYQQEMTDSADRPDMIEEFNISTAILAMDVTMTKAKETWYYDNPEDGYQKTMDLLRKVGGMITQMGEKYGMPERKY